jgi:hypothetical protein
MRFNGTGLRAKEQNPTRDLKTVRLQVEAKPKSRKRSDSGTARPD